VANAAPLGTAEDHDKENYMALFSQLTDKRDNAAHRNIRALPVQLLGQIHRLDTAWYSAQRIEHFQLLRGGAHRLLTLLVFFRIRTCRQGSRTIIARLTSGENDAAQLNTVSVCEILPDASRNQH
jgi:hypothetical protein